MGTLNAILSLGTSRSNDLKVELYVTGRACIEKKNIVKKSEKKLVTTHFFFFSKYLVNLKYSVYYTGFYCMERTKIPVVFKDNIYEQLMFTPKNVCRRNIVLIIPSNNGYNKCDATLEYLHLALRLGYRVVLIDLYGSKNQEDYKKREISRYYRDNLYELNELVEETLKTVTNATETERSQFITIGFCMGGLTVMNIALNFGIKQAYAIHGLPEVIDLNTRTTSPIHIFDGAQDPLIDRTSFAKLIEAYTNQKVPWILTQYGQGKHSFSAKTHNNYEYRYADTTIKLIQKNLEDYY